MTYQEWLGFMQQYLQSAEKYSSIYSGQQIDEAIGKVRNPDTTPTANSSALITSGAVKSAIINQNLLDNAYFVGGGSQQGGGQFPINQRGQTSYVYNYLGGYTVDRWKCQTGGTVTVASDGVVINGYSPYGNYANIFQTYENSLSGKKVTASVLINGTELITGTATLTSTYAQFSSADGKTLLFVTGSYFMVRHDGGDGDTVTVNAAKLELGDTQTLAHQEGGVWVLNELPNFQQELAKCQRYFQLFRTQSLRPTYAVDFRPVMATASPTLGTITIDGTTYYTASSDL